MSEAVVSLDFPDFHAASTELAYWVPSAPAGLSTKTLNKPKRKAEKPIGSRNCQAETPVERATTSSYLRLSEVSVAIAENRAMNGTICSRMNGRRIADSASAADIR